MKKIVTQEGIEIEVPDEEVLVDLAEEVEEVIEEEDDSVRVA